MLSGPPRDDNDNENEDQEQIQLQNAKGGGKKSKKQIEKEKKEKKRKEKEQKEKEKLEKLKEKEKEKKIKEIVSETLTQIKESLETINPLVMSQIKKTPEFPSPLGTIGQEDKKAILNYPLSAIGLLKSDFGNSVIIYGTAALIAPKIILTSAHLLYNSTLKKKIISGTFYLNAHNGVCLSETQVVTFIYPPEFENSNDVVSTEDYAICVLEADIGKSGGYLGICPYNEKENTKGYLYGYMNKNGENNQLIPSSMSSMKDYCIYGVETDLRLSAEKKFLLYVGNTTFNGQDGSPVFKIKYNTIEEGFMTPSEDIQIFAVDCSMTKMILNLHRNYRIGQNNPKEIIYHRINRAIPLTNERYLQIIRWMNFYLSVVPANLNQNNHEQKSLQMRCSELIGKDVPMILSAYDLNNVKKLDLSNNSINFEGIKQLIKAKDFCRGLIDLNLSENVLEEKAANFLAQGTFDSLIKLNISINYLYPEGIHKLSQGNFLSVIELDISNNMIGNEGIEYLVRGNFDNITILRCEYNQIDDKGAYQLSRGNMSEISQLYLKSNKIGDKGVLFLSRYKIKKITKIDLEWNNISPIGLWYLVGAGNEENVFSEICEINVSNNNLGPEGASTLASQSSKHLKSISIGTNEILTKGAEMIGSLNLEFLEHLDAKNNYINDMGVYFLSKGVLKNLKSLNLSLNQITEEGAKYISNGVFSQALEELDLGGNLIKDAGMNYLCNGNLRNLIKLDINLNQLTQKSGLFLCACNFINLADLNIARNDLTLIGVKDLVKARFIQKIEKFDISYNNIGDGGCSFLASAVFKKIKFLCLKDNNISSSGIKSLCEAFWKQIEELNLEDNFISREGIIALSKSAFNNLRFLRLKGNKIRDEDISILKACNMKKLDKENGLTLVNYSQVNMSVIRFFLREECAIEEQKKN